MSQAFLGVFVADADRKAEGAELTFLTSPAYDRRMVEAIQQMVNDVGLKVNVVVLDHGVKIADGTPDVVKSNQDVIDAYLGVAH